MYSRGEGLHNDAESIQKDTHFRQHVFSMQHIFGQCRDFANETSALQEKFRVLGHGLTMSPKGHPRLAEVVMHGKYVLPEVDVLSVYF